MDIALVSVTSTFVVLCMGCLYGWSYYETYAIRHELREVLVQEI